MAVAFLPYATKQGAYLAAPRHHGELVHGGDHHSGRAVVDFFIHHQYWNARMGLLSGLAFGKIAATFLVAAVDEGATRAFVDLDITSGGHFRTAPWATGELRWRRARIEFFRIPYR